MGRKLIKNTNALMDWFGRHRDEVQNCGCQNCVRAFEEYKRFNLGVLDARRFALETANAAAEEHGWR